MEKSCCRKISYFFIDNITFAIMEMQGIAQLDDALVQTRRRLQNLREGNALMRLQYQKDIALARKKVETLRTKSELLLQDATKQAMPLQPYESAVRSGTSYDDDGVLTLEAQVCRDLHSMGVQFAQKTLSEKFCNREKRLVKAEMVLQQEKSTRETLDVINCVTHRDDHIKELQKAYRDVTRAQKAIIRDLALQTQPPIGHLGLPLAGSKKDSVKLNLTRRNNSTIHYFINTSDLARFYMERMNSRTC